MNIDTTHPHRVYFNRSRYHQLQEMIDWCEETFGKSSIYYGDDNWRLDTNFGEQRWLFKNQSDATMFALRWT